MFADPRLIRIAQIVQRQHVSLSGGSDKAGFLAVELDETQLGGATIAAAPDGPLDIAPVALAAIDGAKALIAEACP